MREVCCAINKDSVVYTVFVDYRGMRVHCNNAKQIEALRHQLIVRWGCDVVDYVSFYSAQRGSINKYEIALVEGRCFTDATVIIRLILLLCFCR